PGKRHAVAGNDLRRVRQIGIELLMAPGDAGVLHGGRIGKVRLAPRLASDHAKEIRSDAVWAASLHDVAGRTAAEEPLPVGSIGRKRWPRQKDQDETSDSQSKSLHPWRSRSFADSMAARNATGSAISGSVMASTPVPSIRKWP